MKSLVIVLITLLSSVTFAQNNFDQDMKKAFSTWEKGNLSAAKAFEMVQKNHSAEWLPKYYQAFTLTLASFEETNPLEKEKLIDEAKGIIHNLETKYPSNEEILNVKALNLSSEIMLNPMMNGFAMMEEVQSVYTKALLLNANNPRSILGQAEFNIGASKFIGGDISKDCKAVEKAVALFEAEKPNQFEPNWGKDRAEMVLNNDCKN